MFAVFLALSMTDCKDTSQQTVHKPVSTGQSTTSSKAAETSIPAASTTETPTTEAAKNEVIEIKDKMFIAQTNEIYINKEDYLGKTIKYEGIFDSSVWEDNGQTYCYVIRYGPGCCPGIDNTAGFEVTWEKAYPQNNDWVEAVGTLEEYGENGETYLRLTLTSLTVLPERGAEYVSQ